MCIIENVCHTYECVLDTPAEINMIRSTSHEAMGDWDMIGITSHIDFSHLILTHMIDS